MPAAAREVYDVSGAGATIAAIIGLSLVAKAQLDVAMHLANIAAGSLWENGGRNQYASKKIKDALAVSPTQL